VISRLTGLYAVVWRMSAPIGKIGVIVTPNLPIRKFAVIRIPYYFSCMNTQTVTIEVAPQVAQILLELQRRAETEGVSLDSLLLPLVAPNGGEEERIFEKAPEERAKDVVEWLKAHSVKGAVADDSRESIYTREDEAL